MPFSQDIPPLNRLSEMKRGMSPEMLKLQILWMKKKALTFLKSGDRGPKASEVCCPAWYAETFQAEKNYSKAALLIK